MQQYNNHLFFGNKRLSWHLWYLLNCVCALAQLQKHVLSITRVVCWKWCLWNMSLLSLRKFNREIGIQNVCIYNLCYLFILDIQRQQGHDNPFLQQLWSTHICWSNSNHPSQQASKNYLFTTRASWMCRWIW